VTVERRQRRFAAARLERVARRLMDASTLCALATVSPGGRAHVNHMYFAWNDRYEVFWFSDPESRHSRNLERDPTAAITVYDSHQVNGRPDRGIQLFGRAGVASNQEVTRLYTRKFRGLDPSGYTAYRFRPRTLKLFDEPAFGPAVFVTARVTRQGLAWSKTEVITGGR
jgi:general stress protein 26